MSLRVLMAIVVAGTSLIGPGALAGQEPSPLAVDDPEAYRVYTFLLSLRLSGLYFGPPSRTVVVIQHETSTWDCMFTRGKRRQPSFVVSNGVARPFNPNELAARSAALIQPGAPVLDAYLAANQTVRTLLPGRELGFPYMLVTAREIFALGLASGSGGSFRCQRWDLTLRGRARWSIWGISAVASAAAATSTSSRRSTAVGEKQPSCACRGHRRSINSLLAFA